MPDTALHLGTETLHLLEQVPARVPAVAFIRHSARESISHLSRAMEAPLTGAGVAAARAWGRALPRGRRLRVKHSPVERCVTTAKCIAEGYAAAGGEVLLEGPVVTLFVPFVRNLEGVIRLNAVCGFDLFLRAWFDGQVPVDVMQPPAEAAAEQLGVALEALGDARAGDLTVLVSHDWNVLLLRERYLDLRHEESGWADFLDGVVAIRDDDGPRVAWGGRVAPVR